jgi:hypothetical protein
MGEVSPEDFENFTLTSTSPKRRMDLLLSVYKHFLYLAQDLALP